MERDDDRGREHSPTSRFFITAPGVSHQRVDVPPVQFRQPGAGPRPPTTASRPSLRRRGSKAAGTRSSRTLRRPEFVYPRGRGKTRKTMTLSGGTALAEHLVDAVQASVAPVHVRRAIMRRGTSPSRGRRGVSRIHSRPKFACVAARVSRAGSNDRIVRHTEMRRMPRASPASTFVAVFETPIASELEFEQRL